MNQLHSLKVAPEYFTAITTGVKPFEVRRKDRPYQVGDWLYLQEYNYVVGYTGRETTRTITYILDNPEYCKDGFVILGLG